MAANELGFDNLLWFMGVVEDIDDGQYLGRCKVRAFGIHPESKVDVPTEDLPWAFMIAGTYNAAVKPPQINSWVFGFFMDGPSAQHPMLLGSMIGMPTTLPSLDPYKGFESQGHASSSISEYPIQSSALTGSVKDRAKEMGDYIKSKGYTEEQTNGILANIYRESAFDPAAVGDSGTSHGLFQMHNSRSTKMKNLVPNWETNWKGQIDQALDDDVGPRYMEETKNMSSGDAAYWWQVKFERPADQVLGGNNDRKQRGFIAALMGNDYDGSSIFGDIGIPAGGGGGQSSLAQTSNPMSTSMFQPNLSSLARGENIGNTHVPFSNAMGARNGAPGSGYGTQYPHNWVHETESGHAFELDDTPGNERVSLTHKSGSQVEMDTSGRVIIKTTGDNWIVVEKNSTAKIRGDWNVSADGHVNITSLNDMNVNCVGDLTTTVNGNYNLNVAGDYNLNVGLVNKSRAMEHTVQATQGSVHLDAKENIQVRSDKTMTLESEESLNLNVKAGSMNMKASGDSINMNSTNDIIQTADTDVKIHSGGIVALTSESLLCLNSKSDLTLVSDAGIALEADKVFNNADAFTVKSDSVVISTGGKLGLKGSTIELDTDLVKGPIPSGKGTAGGGSSVSTGSAPNKPDALEIEGDAALGQTELPKPPTRKVPINSQVNSSSGSGTFSSSDDYGEGLGDGPTNTLSDSDDIDIPSE